MYRIMNLTKTGPVRLSGHMLQTKSVEVDRPLDLTPQEYKQYHPCIDALNKAGKINVTKVDPEPKKEPEKDEEPKSPETPPATRVDNPETEKQPDPAGLNSDPSPKEPEGGEEFTQASLSAMTVADLTPLATSLGINPSGLRKDALIEAILEKTESK